MSRCLRLAAAWVVVAAALTACGGTPLEPRSPAGFDLNGPWLADDAAPPRLPRRAAYLAQDFPVLAAREMRIEQDARSMGIDFDRGRYRDVTWGERRRGIWEVRAGWHDGALHIHAKASDAEAREIWRLLDDGQRLVIDIELRGALDRKFRRTFRRAPLL